MSLDGLDDVVPGPRKKIVLLGMIYNENEVEPSRGQGYRDWVRCNMLTTMGWDVFTIDDKHTSNGRHCNADFNSRFFKDNIFAEFSQSFGASIVMLDYFFGPAHWNAERWKPDFFKKTLPWIAASNFVVVGGKVVLQPPLILSFLPRPSRRSTHHRPPSPTLPLNAVPHTLRSRTSRPRTRTPRTPPDPTPLSLAALSHVSNCSISHNRLLGTLSRWYYPTVSTSAPRSPTRMLSCRYTTSRLSRTIGPCVTRCLLPLRARRTSFLRHLKLILTAISCPRTRRRFLFLFAKRFESLCLFLP